MLFDSPLTLEFRKLIIWQGTVSNIPTKSRELHTQHHLRAGDVYDIGIKVLNTELGFDVVGKKVAHNESKIEPWHQRALEVLGDGKLPNALINSVPTPLHREKIPTR